MKIFIFLVGTTNWGVEDQDPHELIRYCSPIYVLCPVLESLPLTTVSGGQVQLRWAGLAWRWPNAKPNLTSGTKLLVDIARNAKLSLPIMILPENAKPQESAHQEPAH